MLCSTVHAARLRDEVKDSCERHKAHRCHYPDRNFCCCPYRGTEFPSKGCRALDDSRFASAKKFSLELADETCRCLNAAEKAEEGSTIVQVAAMRFRAEILKLTASANPINTGERGLVIYKEGTFSETLPDFLRKMQVTPEVCSKILTGTWQGSRNDFADAAQLSIHKDTKGLGHLDPLVSVPTHRHLLNHVCKDECEEIVSESLKRIGWMYAFDVNMHQLPFEQSCANHVVRRVEAEILGCCGRACGWNNRTCRAWPFFAQDEKVEWLEQCCTEYNVLQNSSRERMCNSVLTAQQVELVAKFDTRAKEDTDVAGSYIGQDPILVWTSKGIAKLQKQLEELKENPKQGEQVSSKVLEDKPKIRKEGIEKGWFQEETSEKEGATSFLQANEECSSKKLWGLHHCHPDTKRQIVKTCLREAGWQMSEKPDLDDIDDESCKMIGSGKAIPVATPDDCLKLSFEEVGKIHRRFFEYKKDIKSIGKTMKDVVPENPILCHVEAESYGCREFDRWKFGFNSLDSKGFEDYLYWLDEDENPNRLQMQS